jgi:hypothetical protein
MAGYSLRGKVGAGGDNNVDDVFVVQVLLGIVIASEKRSVPWSEFTLGQTSKEFEDEIRAFQRKNTASRDGRIDPGGATWRALLAKATRVAGGILPPLPPAPNPGPNPSTGNVLRAIGPQAWMMWSPPGPLLQNPSRVDTTWDIDFFGVPARGMDGVAFLTPNNWHVKCIGLVVPKNCTPKGYVIYFRHTAKPDDYPTLDSMIKLGIGDHMVGRTQLLNQVSASGKDVGVILPMARTHLGEFAEDEAAVTQCLQEIDQSVTGQERELPPLAVACYSDGIGELDKFLTNCPKLAKKVIAVYDMDGSLVTRFRHVTLNVSGAQVFRYKGGGAPGRLPREDDTAFLARTSGGAPSVIPLPKSRFKKHPNYRELRGGDMWWLHHYIPSCMLTHGLVKTTGF